MKFIALILTIFALPFTLFAQNNTLDNVQIKTQHVAKNIYMLHGQGGNIGLLVGDNSVFMIDDQFAPLHNKIVAAIRKISDKPIEFVLNTHFHNDHTGGNEALGKQGAHIIAHQNVRTRLQRYRPKNALPVLTFKDGIALHLGDELAKVQHYPHAHTDGDVVVYFTAANVIHTGDLFFKGRYPFIDVKNGGSVQGLIAGMEDIVAQADNNTKIIPGHGRLANKQDLEADLHVLRTLKNRVQSMIDNGKTLKEVLSAKPSAEYDAAYGNGFIKSKKMVSDIYISLTQ